MYQNSCYTRGGIDSYKTYNTFKTDTTSGYSGYNGNYGYGPHYGSKYANNVPYHTFHGYNRSSYHNYKKEKYHNYNDPNNKGSDSNVQGVWNGQEKCLSDATQRDQEKTHMVSAEHALGQENNTKYSSKEKNNNHLHTENYSDYHTGRNVHKDDHRNTHNYWKGNYYYEDKHHYQNQYVSKKDNFRDGHTTYKGGGHAHHYDFYRNDKTSYWQNKSSNINSRYSYKKRYYPESYYRRPYNEDHHYSKYDRSQKRAKVNVDKCSDMSNFKKTPPHLSDFKNNMYRKHCDTYSSHKKREDFCKDTNGTHMSNKRHNMHDERSRDNFYQDESIYKKAKYYDSKYDDCARDRSYYGISSSYVSKKKNRKRDQLSSSYRTHGDSKLKKKRLYNKEGEDSLKTSRSSFKKHGWDSMRKEQRNKRHRSKSSHCFIEEEKKRKKKNYGSESHSPSNASMNKIVHFSWHEGMILDNMYRIEKKMGDGTFGRVLLCRSLETNEEYAIKVVRNKKRYTKSAKIEADILKKVQNNNPQNNNIVKYYGKFMHKNHMCLMFEPLGPSLYEILKKNDFHGFPLEDIKCFCVEILKALRYLRKMRLTHTDIKPENILLDDPDFKGRVVTVIERESNREIVVYRTKSTGIRLIDFGCATFSHDYHGSIINTRQYRAPEVILNLGWNESSDMWSFGCVLFEMYTGYLLFKTHDHLEHLALMEARLGPIPKRMIVSSLKTNGVRYIHKRELRLNWPEGAENSCAENYVKRCAPISDVVKHEEFCEFLKFILEIDPRRRPTPSEALRHKFLHNVTRTFL